MNDEPMVVSFFPTCYHGAMSERLRALLRTSILSTNPSYSATIFLSAFLLFQIQPMIARYLLPFFGGAVSVWAASLVFFTSVLFLGYTYAFALSGLSKRIQVRVHAALLMLAALFSLLTLIAGSYPSITWVFDATSAPSNQVLLALLVCIGIPYFLLSTTGPLLQHWYSRETGKEPYHLYALSNAGSLIALGTYPFVIEPLIGLSNQQMVWSALFLACVGLIGFVAYRHRGAVQSEPTSAPAEHIPLTRIALWLTLSALPAAMLVATTTRITQTLTPFPFLWIIPLALYLLSFICAFRGWGGRGLTPFALIIAALASYAYLDWSFATTSYQLLANLSLFFLGALYCHALLYQARPQATLSSFFYFWTSLGGAVGTLLVTLIAPLVFVDVLEFSLGMGVLAAIAIGTFPAMTYVRDEFTRGTVVIKGALLVGVIIFATQYVSSLEDTALESSRNFFGVVHVYDYGMMRSLQHGTTMHGSQFTDPERTRQATSYYSPTSGVGRAIINARASRNMEPISVGVVGLGAGTLAAYCEKGDVFTFYEIDERIGRIANEYFSYLSECERASIVYGDGRLSLSNEFEKGKKGNYDVLAIDAFSDDTIPVHLLTKEAVELYMTHVRTPESVLAIHTSNRFFELSPIVMRIAVELGLSAMVIMDNPETDGATLSQWVLLTRDAAALQKQIFSEGATEPPYPSALWTDDYANVFAALDKSALQLWNK